ncbi:MAG: right-handed parallel beta-helix repeat-containing protein, partial [Candidatus Heimdallarchaeota archaeon]
MNNLSVGISIGQSLSNSIYNEIRDNSISNLTSIGVSLGAFAKNIYIFNNTISDIFSGLGQGIRLYASENNTIDNNSIINASK